MADLKYWLWLTTRNGLSPAGAMAVLDHFVTPERAFYGEEEDFDLLPLSGAAKRSLLDKSLDGADKILGDCDRLSMRIMTFQDAEYPQRLRQIADPPMALYIKGKTFRFDEEVAIGIVGAREPSQASEARAERFGMELAANGALVVSGIAQGIDCHAVRGALNAGGPVVSVLAGGADLYFPRENRYLYDDVAAVGALISEYPPGTPHKGSHFRPRNRILSGLCLGVLAVECNTYGGTMLTVNHANDQGRDVFAIPIGLNEQCARGTNRLIHDRLAQLVDGPEDILREYAGRFPTKLARFVPLPEEVVRARLSGDKPSKPPAKTPAGTPEAPAAREEAPRKRERIKRSEQKSRFTDDELAVLAATADSALTADEIVEKTQIPARYILTSITMLQLQELLEERPGRRFYARVELE